MAIAAMKPPTAYAVGLLSAVLLAAAAMTALLSLTDVAMSGRPLDAPGASYLLGTDRLGRSVLATTAIGSLRSLAWATLALSGAAVIGVFLGLVSVANLRAPVDDAIQILADAIRSFPSIVAALLFVSVSVPLPILLVLYFWVPVWRVSRAQVGAQRFRPYILNAILFGHSRFSALRDHGLPNASTGILGVLFVVYAELISVQIGLEFLGFSEPLSTPTLGNIITDAIRLGIPYAWTWAPAAVVTILASILLFVIGQYLIRREGQMLE
ncbi:peptide ABC transporter permease [Thalassobaculum fulvum]|uniref:Peptide ABC transporter permease n=1 Tax=Thalassobaculum fulvum TaxID=1633335 RepID=A0A918XV66_9PROT|nr:peptide ABC transporter permease [Thalassobaculum fulvum]